MYKLVVSDLDGTLLNNESVLTEFSKKIIEEISNEGIHFFIATGRHFFDVFRIQDELGLPNTYSISCNGARVHDPKGNLIIGHNHVDKIAKEILLLDLDEEISASVYTDEKVTLFSEKELFQYDGKTYPYEVVEKDDFVAKNIIKWYYHAENHEKLMKLKKKIDETWGEYVDTIFSLEICLEVMPKGISKGYAIEEIARIEGINISEIIAFGDGFNDLEMLNTVGKGIIMENASEKLKIALPNNEIIGKNTDDSVAKYLQKLFL